LTSALSPSTYQVPHLEKKHQLTQSQSMEPTTDNKEPQLPQLQTSTPSQPGHASNTFVTTLYVANIHCQSCVSYAQEVLKPIEEVTKVDISVADHSIRVEHYEDVADKIRQEITDAAFEVQRLQTSDSRGVIEDAILITAMPAKQREPRTRKPPQTSCRGSSIGIKRTGMMLRMTGTLSTTV
jgi:copper chaperone CopZ